MNTVHFKEHSVVEKEKSSSYLSRFCCLDNVGHHIKAEIAPCGKEGDKLWIAGGKMLSLSESLQA